MAGQNPSAQDFLTQRELGARSNYRYLTLAVLSPVILILVWDLVVRFGIVDSLLLPSPVIISQAFWDIVSNGYSGSGILIHVGMSLYRVVVAFVAATIVGIVFGLLRGAYRDVNAVLLVPAETIRPIPPLAFIPLFILWFGIGELSKILLIFYYVTLIVMLNTEAGVRSVPTDKIRAAQSLGASSRQIFSFVVIPAALPHIMAGLRVSAAAGFSILVASELLGGDLGLGFVIIDASTFFRMPEVFVGIILIGVLGFTWDRGLDYLFRRLVHWEGKN
jgi:ABC-type nitrate/sulfonate/bicarbonate transport system permease component